LDIVEHRLFSIDLELVPLVCIAFYNWAGNSEILSGLFILWWAFYCTFDDLQTHHDGGL